MKKLVILAQFAWLTAGSAWAGSVTIDFEAFTDGQEGFGAIQTQGFTITSIPYSEPGNFPPDYAFSDGITGNPTISYGYCPDCTARLEDTTGDLFSLHSIDLAVLSFDPAAIYVRGYQAGGGIVQQYVAAPPSGIMDTISFDSSWVNLERVEFGASGSANNAGHWLDNIRTTVVPIPAAAWLFVSALAALGWRRTK